MIWGDSSEVGSISTILNLHRSFTLGTFKSSPSRDTRGVSFNFLLCSQTSALPCLPCPLRDTEHLSAVFSSACEDLLDSVLALESLQPEHSVGVVPSSPLSKARTHWLAHGASVCEHPVERYAGRLFRCPWCEGLLKCSSPCSLTVVLGKLAINRSLI